MAEGTFTAQVRAAVAKRKDLMREVYIEAVEDHIDIMQTTKAAGGNMPVRDGFLRASLKAGIGHVSFPVAYKPAGDTKYAFDGAAISLVIQGAKVTDPITVSYTANYARPREFGTRG